MGGQVSGDRTARRQGVAFGHDGILVRNTYVWVEDAEPHGGRFLLFISNGDEGSV